MPEQRDVAGPRRTPFTANQQDFVGVANIHVSMLRWACAVRNISFHAFEGDERRKRWVAFGKNVAVGFRKNMPSLTSTATRATTNDKHRTKAVLAANGIPAPDGIRLEARETETALSWFRSMKGSPVVVKPVTGWGGKGVATAIVDPDDLVEAMRAAGKEVVVLERYISGDDYRVLVVGGRFIAAIRRHPAFVIGDGRSTVHDLVQQKNVKRRPNPYAGRKPLKVDAEVEARLALAGLTKESVPALGERVRLRQVANVSLGGDSEDVTEVVHPDFIALVEAAWRAFPDLAFCGVDLIAEDITRATPAQQHAVIEINANCDLAMHHFPTILGHEPPIDAAGAIIDYVFPDQPPAELHALSLTVLGEVQRVGYLTWLRRQAVSLGLSGHGELTETGVVTVHLEGTRSALDEVLRRCARGSAKSTVTSMRYETCPVEGYEGFEIRS